MTNPEQRIPSPDEQSAWTREFLKTDFWNLLLKPRLEVEQLDTRARSRLAALEGSNPKVMGWTYYGMALDALERWFTEWLAASKDEQEVDLEPAPYVETVPRYPKGQNEV